MLVLRSDKTFALVTDSVQKSLVDDYANGFRAIWDVKGLKIISSSGEEVYEQRKLYQIGPMFTEYMKSISNLIQ